ncbi:MAG TPA: GGDEF domain-containing protein [Candidatus Limnocylindrales bacterium]|nr:GGDEF domain-containing protein [Candidatus Limnocylindrales bacterium]
MPVEPVQAQTLILLAVVANLLVMAAVVVPPLLGRRGPLQTGSGAGNAGERKTAELAAVLGEAGDVDLTDIGVVPPGAYDRVVRIVSWVFILATSTIVAVTGLWRETQPAVFALLAAAGLFVLVVHDLLPPGALGTAKFVLEGSVAVTFATLLVVLTGREASPFFFTFPLIVGGAALVVTPRVTFALAAAASTAYIVAIAPPGSGGLPPMTVAIVGINITALILLAYVAMVIAREQRRARDAAIRLSTIDNLTGLFNRTFFFAAVEREIARSARSGRGFCLLMMDLDELKQINDRNGHFFGDRVLRGVGEVIRSGGRRIDTSARYGGDEFVVLLPETDPTGAFVLAEKIRLGVADLRVDVAGSMIQPSISIGVVSYPEDGRTSDELMITADTSMYRSKHAGKNRVTGVPHVSGVPVMDETVVSPRAGEELVAVAGKPSKPRRKPADKSV